MSASEKAVSYSRIVKSSSIIGGASLLNIIIGLLRTKVMAMWLGPVGIGLYSIYNSLVLTATALGGMGIATVGTRRIAECEAEHLDADLARVRRALGYSTCVLAVCSAFVVWLFRHEIAALTLHSSGQGNVVGWLALGVALTIFANTQAAVLQGFRRIADLAWLSILSALIYTALGVAILWFWRTDGLILFVLLGPLVGWVMGRLFVARLPAVAALPFNWRDLSRESRLLFGMGLAFMGAALIQALSQLLMRMIVQHDADAASVGYYQAAWSISIQYIGFVLVAMGSDYYPRLSGIIKDKAAAVRLINEQTEVALLLAAPVLVFMMGFAADIISLLYSKEFLPVVSLFRWQVFGDILKLASWPLGFAILALGDGRGFIWTELIAGALLVGITALLMPLYGLDSAGMGFLACYAIYLPLVYWYVRRRLGFAWGRNVLRLLGMNLVLCTFVACLAMWTDWAPIVSGAIALLLGFFALHHLARAGVLPAHRTEQILKLMKRLKIVR